MMLRDFIEKPSSHRLKLSITGVLQRLEWLEWLRNDQPSMLPSTRLRSKDEQRQSPAIVLHQARTILIRISLLENEKDMLIRGEI